MSLWNNEITSFAVGATYGAIKGAFYAGLAWVPLLAFGAVPATVPALMLVLGLGALAFSLYDGVSAVHDYQARKNGVKLGDRAAAGTGAVPLRQQIRQASIQREMDESAIKGTQSYTQILDEQREQRQELGGHHHGR